MRARDEGTRRLPHRSSTHRRAGAVSAALCAVTAVEGRRCRWVPLHVHAPYAWAGAQLQGARCSFAQRGRPPCRRAFREVALRRPRLGAPALRRRLELLRARSRWHPRARRVGCGRAPSGEPCDHPCPSFGNGSDTRADRTKVESCLRTFPESLTTVNCAAAARRFAHRRLWARGVGRRRS